MVIGLSGIQFGLYTYEWYQNRTTAKRESDLFITSMITDRIGQHELIIKVTISEKRKIAKLCDKGKFYNNKLTKDA